MNSTKALSTALVVDDHRPTAESICRMLELLGLRAEPAYGSQAALLALKEETPDLVFLDIHLPGISGFEVLRYIQREPHLQRTKVIVITSDDQEETIHRSKSEGASEVMIKPVTLEDLEKIISKL